MLCQVFLLPNYYYFSAMLDYDHETTLVRCLYFYLSD